MLVKDYYEQIYEEGHILDDAELENLPNNWYEQFIEIKEILLKNELVIADIQYKNICVLNNIIYLIDFGFSHKGSILEVERDIKILYKRLNDLHIKYRDIKVKL